jgi:hypothetical protein
MKESEFIELLNLYVDHEIGAEDAKRLEAEVAADPARHAIYRQYCSMQKACTLLADRFQEPVAGARPVAVRGSAWRWTALIPASGLALAACVAVVLAVRSHVPAPAPAAHAAPQAPVQKRSELTSIAPGNYQPQLVPALSVRDFSLNAGAPASEGLMASAGQGQAASLAWIAQLQMGSVQPVPAAEVNFKPNAAFLSTDIREESRASGEQEPAETVAFRFQR